jgi:hypothetical protein
MITKISFSPMSGLKKNFSIKNPKRKQPTSVKIKAIRTGRFAHVTKAKKKKAPSARSSPWAKFKTLDDLKIMTKPMADIP